MSIATTIASLNNFFEILHKFFFVTGIFMTVAIAVMYILTIANIRKRRSESSNHNMMSEVDDVITSIGTKILTCLLYTSDAADE